MVMRPLEESSFALGWTTDSELMLMVWFPAKFAESEMMMDDEKLTGAFGPCGTLGSTEWRLFDEDMVLVDLIEQSSTEEDKKICYPKDLSYCLCTSAPAS
jgi:hypothetical protein